MKHTARQSGIKRDTLLETLVGELGRLGTRLHTKPQGRPGFGLAHFKLFFIVSRQPGGVAVKKLAAMLGVTPSAVTQVVDPLVAHGIFERTVDARDRRSTRISLSKKPNAECERFKKEFLATSRALFAGLTDTDLVELVRLFTKINNHVKR